MLRYGVNENGFKQCCMFFQCLVWCEQQFSLVRTMFWYDVDYGLWCELWFGMFAFFMGYNCENYGLVWCVAQFIMVKSMFLVWVNYMAWFDVD